MARIDFPLVDRPASYSTSNTIERLSIPIERRQKLFEFRSMSAVYIRTHKPSGLGMRSIFKTSSTARTLFAGDDENVAYGFRLCWPQYGQTRGGLGPYRLLHWHDNQDGKARKRLHCKFEQRQRGAMLIDCGELRGALEVEQVQYGLIRCGNDLATCESHEREQNIIAVVKQGIGRFERFGGEREFHPSERFREE